MAIDVTCELTITNTTSSNRRGVVYFQLDTSGEYFRHEGLVEIQSSTTLSHTFYDVDETITHIIYAYDANFYLLDTYVLDAAMYGELTAILDSTTIHCSFPVNNTSTATLSISIFFSLNSSDAIRYTHSVPPESSYTFTHDFTSVDIYEDNIVYIRDSEFNELDSVTIPGLSPGDIFTYSGFTAIYADDIDYNDVISCSLTATNNSAIAQNCIIYFKLGDYLVQQTYTIPSSSSYSFTYTFENIDIFQENIVTVFNSANQLIDSVTIPAYPDFEMFFEAKVGSMTAKYDFSALESCKVIWGDGTEEDIAVVDEYQQYTSQFSHVYSTIGMKRITFSNPAVIRHFRIGAQTETATSQQYYINDISQLRNINLILIMMLNATFLNITYSTKSFAKATKRCGYQVLSTNVILNDSCFSRKVYTYFYLRNCLNFQVSANKISEILYYVRNFFLILNSSAGNIANDKSIDIPELILCPFLNVQLYISYCNCPNIDRNSNFGQGYSYYFYSSNLTSEAVDNVIYVLVNTNNYVGSSAKNANLLGNARRTHASDADLAVLLSRGWVVLVSEPL